MKHPLVPERSYHNMDAFPSRWWMDPWKETREDPHTAPALPQWMSREAVAEIEFTEAKDPDFGKAWWGQLWATAGDARKDREFMMLATAMAVAYGWPEVARDLVKNGAPLEPISRGGPQWKHMEAKYKMRDKLSVLDLVVYALELSTASHPLHPRQRAGLRALLELGADPNQMLYRTQMQALRGMDVAADLAAAGWNIGNRGKTYDKEAPQSLLQRLLGRDITLSNPCRGKVLGAFIKHGMPLELPGDDKSLIEHLAQSVAGLSMLPIAMTHPDKAGLAQSLSKAEPLLRKRAERMNEAERTKFLSQMQIYGLEMASPQVTTQGRRPRL